MKTNNDPAIARTIRRQLGTALPMFGAKDLTDTGHGLRFRIGRNPKRVTHIAIDLAADDTYTVTFARHPSVKAWCNGAEIKTLGEFDGIYVGSLHSLLESNTGLATRL